MTSRVIPVAPFALAVFGATGDLAMRKLFPALWRRVQAGQAPAESKIIGIARAEIDRDEFRRSVADNLKKASAIDDESDPRLRDFLAGVDYVAIDAESADGWDSLAAALDGAPRPTLFYLAVAPALAAPICRRLRENGFFADGDARLVLEKPFGRDLESARELNRTVRAACAESQIYRIDHYLGKETVQNLMALRFANALFEPLWNARAIDHVQITVAESIGVKGRGGYYDRAGAARDMLQNHLLQLLCLAAMEPPARYTAAAVRDEKQKALSSLRPFAAADKVVIGQYAGGHGCDSYLQDLQDAGVEKSKTETFVAVKCEIDNWRWAGTPFYLRTGKRLAARMSEIAVCFREPPHSIFDGLPGLAAAAASPQNTLVMRLQPREGVTMRLNIKDPGPGGFRLTDAALDMSFADSFGGALPDAYERLLMDVVRGDQTLFMRDDELEAAWDWIDPIVSHIERTKPLPYLCGSSGPDDALRLTHADGRKWREIA